MPEEPAHGQAEVLGPLRRDAGAAAGPHAAAGELHLGAGELGIDGRLTAGSGRSGRSGRSAGSGGGGHAAS